MTYADTSALLKLLVEEAETAALRKHLEAATEDVLSCELTLAELMRTALRAGVNARAVNVLLGQLSLLVLDRPLLLRAGRLPSPPGTFLRTADAVHIAAALELGVDTFLTYDWRQAQAAGGAGFDVIAPGRAADWHR